MRLSERSQSARFAALMLGAWLCARAAQVDGAALVGWNNLGMHGMDADYSVFALLPPYNTIHAQLIDTQGRLVRDPSGISVTYEAVADPDGSINSTSLGKTNFWQYVPALFGLNLDVDVGLAGKRMPGSTNQPQALSFDSAAGWFVAEGIPITPYDDAQRKNPYPKNPYPENRYPMMRLIARDSSGQAVANTDVVLPVSDEMDCTSCHASNSSAAAQPVDGWVNDPDPQRDMRLNILRLHDDRELGRDTFVSALATAGYNPFGLFTTAAVEGRSILCARCHGSAALPGSGITGVSPLTQAVHRRMALVQDPVTGLLLDAVENRSACYRCHPGSPTRGLRGAMGNAVAADGTRAIQCQSCHGTTRDVASPNRSGWLDEPACQSCHTGTAIHNNGAIRFTSVFDSSGAARVAVDHTFATNADTPAPGLSLYRFSTGHGGIACEACHGSTHAEFPSSHSNDNIQSIEHQGHVGALAECAVCHTRVPATVNGGPHGMHPLGQAWVDRHPDAIEEGDVTQCQACHGADYRGTVLSRAQADRVLHTDFGTKQIWRGFQIGCYTCHHGPDGVGAGEGASANRAAIAYDATAATTLDTPVTVPLNASDADSNVLSLRIVSQPNHGTASIAGATATYFPENGFVGADTLTFAAWDGATDSNLATVSIDVAAGAPICPGDCNNDDVVSVDELVSSVSLALGDTAIDHCVSCDLNSDGSVTIDELAHAVNASLNGCTARPGPSATATIAMPPTATPTPTPTSTAANGPTGTPTTAAPVTVADVQPIFNATCVDQFCHTAADRAGDLVLESGSARAALIDVPAVNPAAHRVGLLRVNPGNPDTSFLVTKLSGPSPAQGSKMPLGKSGLTAAQLQLIRDWVTQGALP